VRAIDTSVYNDGLRVLLVDINCVNRNINARNENTRVLRLYSSRSNCMKPSLLLIKREIGRNIENPKKEISFAVINLDVRKDYPANFVCVLPLSHCLFSGHSIFSKLFGEDSIRLAKKLLSKALAEESDSETKTEIGKRLKPLNPKTVVEAKCRVCGNLFELESFQRHYQKTCQKCNTRMIVSAQ
jgi:DNA-directed RNA polymerase subunit RPC12/RpoP